MTYANITFLDFPKSEAVEFAIQRRVEKLESFAPKINRCDVLVSCPHRHHYNGRIFHIQIHVHISGQEEIVVNRHLPNHKEHSDIYLAIRDTFDSLERIVKERRKMSQGRIKSHLDPYSEGKILKIFPMEGFGFLITSDGREIYFSENSLLKDGFSHLEVGQRVKFVEEPGQKGPQVTSMSAV